MINSGIPGSNPAKVGFLSVLRYVRESRRNWIESGWRLGFVRYNALNCVSWLTDYTTSLCPYARHFTTINYLVFSCKDVKPEVLCHPLSVGS